MKKLMLIAFALLVSGALQTQDIKETKVEKKSFLTLNGGPSFPVGVFNALPLILTMDTSSIKMQGLLLIYSSTTTMPIS